MSIVLGLNGLRGVGHDAAAALVVDGRLAAAVEEERLVRKKRAYNLAPLNALREVLDVAGVASTDIDLIAYPWVPAAMGVADDDLRRQILGWFEEAELPVRANLPVRWVEHHLAHAWSGMAFVPGGIDARRLGVLVMDGTGESTSGACYTLGEDLTSRWRLPQSSSLGIYFEAASEYLGFGWGEEGKTMGLAAYGREVTVAVPPLPDQRIDGPLAPLAGEDSPRELHVAIRQRFVDAFRALHGDHLSFNRRADVALAAQQAVGRRLLAYAAELLDEIDVLVVSGGVALNCSINKEVADLCRTKGVELVIPPPASDTGIALGSAVAVSMLEGVGGPASLASVSDPFLGRPFDPEDVARALHRLAVPVRAIYMKNLAAWLLDRSLVCAWFEGRSEIGPRALGKRCIIARADSPAVRDRINVMKRRESWRPLAPSVTRREFDRCFQNSTPSPYMLVAAAIAPKESARLSGVIHVDDTARPQVVASPGPFLDLLTEVGIACGTEAVTCTSLNRAGDPIVYSPTDALTTARALGVDMLAGDGWYVPLASSRS